MTMTKQNKSNLQRALDYVRRELGVGALTVVRYQRNVNWLRRQPVTTDHDDEIIDLLEDVGVLHDIYEGVCDLLNI